MESELGRVVDALPGLVWTALPDGQIAFLSRRWSEYTGLGVDESLGRGWQAAVHPQDLPPLLAGWHAESAANAVETEVRLRAPDGKYRWFLFRAHPSADASGRVAQWCGLGTEIDERIRAGNALREDQQRAQALLDGEKRLLEMVASGRPMSDTLEALCRLVESTASGSYCSIILLDPSGSKLQEAIAPSLPAEFNDAVRGWPIARLGGPCQTVARDNVQVIMSDVASDDRWRNSWRGLAQKHGLRSCWSTPIVSQAGNVLGTFALYWNEPESPNALQLELIEQFTSIASIAIERAQRDAALLRSEARLADARRDLQSMIDTIPVFVAAYEPDGTRSFVNRRWQDYMGLTSAEATGPGAKVFPHFHPDDASMNDKAWRASLASGEPVAMEVRVRRADGQYRRHTSERVPLRDENGNIVRWYSVGIDIEDRKRAEEALRRSEARQAEAERELQRTIDTLPTLVATYRPDGSRSFVNQTWRDYTGISLEDAERSNIVHPDDATRVAHEWRVSLAWGAPFRAELRLRRADGEYRWHAVHLVPARDQAGEIIKFYNVAVDIEERKRAEEALRQSELSSRSIIDGIPGFVAILAPNGDVEAVNRQILEYCGRPLEELRDWGTNGTIYEADLPYVAEIFTRSIAAGVPYEIEQRLRRFDGAYLWFNNRGVPVRDNAGQIVCWYVLLTDIDERKRAEEALRESEYKSRLIVDSVPGLVAVFTPDGRFELINRQIVEYFGRTLDDIKLKRWGPRDGIHPEDHPRVTEVFKQSIASGDPFEFEVRCQRFDGVYRWFQSRGFPLRDTSGRIVRWYNLLIDIDERKRAEEALQQSEARLSAAERELRVTLDTIPVMVWRGAANGYVQQLNKRWFEYTGTTPEQVRGRRWKQCVHPDDLERHVQIGTDYVAAGVPIDSEARLRRFDGEYRRFLFRPAAARDENGSIVGWYGTIIDIEDRKRAEEKVVEAERELQRTLDHIPVLVSTYSADGSRVYVNKQVPGYTDRDTPTDWLKGIHPDDFESVESKWRACIASGEPFETELRWRMADGTYRWHLTRRVPLRDETGKIIRWYGVGYDIEDRKRAEQKAIEAERDLQHMIDHIPAMVATYRADGLRLSINKRLRDYIGAVPSEDREQTIQNRRTAILRIHPDDAELAESKWRESIVTGEPYQHEYRVRRYDGKYRWVMRHRVPVRDETGKIIRWYGVGYEIEDRKRAEEKVVEAERELQRTIDNIPILVGTYSADGRRLFANKRALEVTGLTAEDVSDERWNKRAFHPDEVASVENQWRACIASGEPFEREVRTCMADGTYRWHWTRRVPLRDETGKVIRWYGASYDIEDRKRAEEQLRRSEALLAKAQRLSLTGSFLFNPETEEATWSDEVYRIHGFEPGTRATLAMVRSRYHPEDLHLLEEQIASIRSGATELDYEHRLLMPDGSIKHVHMVAQGSRGEAGGSIEYIGAVQDITRRRVAEEELRRSEAFLAKAQQLSLTGSFSFKSATQEFTWSEELYRIFDFEPGVRVTLQLISTRYHPEDRHVMEGVAEGIRNGAPAFDYEHRLLMPDSSIKHIHIVAHGTPDEEGNGMEYFGAVQDVTQRRVAEEGLRRSEAYLAEAQRLSHTGSWVVDYVNRKPIYSSEEHHRLFGFDPADGMPPWRAWMDRIHPEDRPRMKELVERSSREKTDLEMDYRICHPDGTVRYIHDVGHPNLNEAGEVAEFVGTSVDVTQRRLAEDALDKARSELAHVTRVMSLGALTASIAHEVNQPLSGIITNASTCLRMLAADPPNIEGARTTAQRTIRDGNRAADVITRLRALFNKKSAATETVDLNEATREVLALVFSDLLRNQVFLRTELDDDHPVLVTGDRVQLQQVILNLVRNAVEAMREVNDRPRHLLVTVAVDDEERARLVVKDVGVGLDPQAMGRLFDAFYTTKDDGMGIGLSVSRSIIENHGGKLWAEANDGPGTMFSFSIPRLADSATGDRTGGHIFTPNLHSEQNVMRNS